MTAKPIPEGYHSVTPYLSIQGAAEATVRLLDLFEALLQWYRPVTPVAQVVPAEDRGLIVDISRQRIAQHRTAGG